MPDLRDPLLWPVVMTQHWLKTAIHISCCFSALFDPRPDLALPARSRRSAYAWWW
jgi:hypothetical protein